MKPAFTIQKAPITRFFEQKNPFILSGFDEWIFFPGMLFHDFQKWWGNGGNRDTPHEGIDLCFYKDKKGQFRRLEEKTKIPVLFHGRIVHIHDDFLGKSIYVRHNICGARGKILHTIYGHTNPGNNCMNGKIVREGDVIADIAYTRKKTGIFPHVHITVVLLPETFLYEQLNWETMHNCTSITFLNPLEMIDGKYSVEYE